MPFYLARSRKQFPFTVLVFEPVVRIATYQPHERPETTRNFLYQFLILSVCIAPYLHREGTETDELDNQTYFADDLV